MFGLTDATSNAGLAARGGDDWARSSGACGTPMTIDPAITVMAMARWRCCKATWLLSWSAISVLGRLLHVIDDQDVDRTFRRFQFQAELFC